MNKVIIEKLNEMYRQQCSLESKIKALRISVKQCAAQRKQLLNSESFSIVYYKRLIANDRICENYCNNYHEAIASALRVAELEMQAEISLLDMKHQQMMKAHRLIYARIDEVFGSPEPIGYNFKETRTVSIGNISETVEIEAVRT